METSGWLLLIALSWPALAAGAAGGGQANEDRGFEALQYQDPRGASLPYRLLKPADYGSSQGKHPLLLFLHGAGERGSDNRAQLKWGKQLMRAAARRGAFVLVPQCPRGKKWVEVDWSAPAHEMPEEPSEPIRLTLEVLERLEKQYRIDPDRLYVMGLSMGGYGTWDLAQRLPEVFAAAVPICGGGDETKADRIRAAVWAFHGDRDPAVPVQRTREMIAAMKAAGATPKYTEYPGVGHDSWNRAFKEPELLNWLLARKRGSKHSATRCPPSSRQ